MKLDEVMKDVLRVKYEFAEENGMDFDRVVASIHASNEANPPPPTPPRRKLIDGHPVGRSVWRDDETLAELRTIKEQLSLEMSVVKPIKRSRKTAAKKTTPVLRPFKGAKARDAQQDVG